MIGTYLTVQAAFIDLGAFNTVVALAIACVKATLVIPVLQAHVKYSTRLTWAVRRGSIFWLGIPARPHIQRLPDASVADVRITGAGSRDSRTSPSDETRAAAVAPLPRSSAPPLRRQPRGRRSASAAALTTQPFAKPGQCGTRAFGYLMVLREGLYRFELRSVTGATVQVDGSAAPESAAWARYFVLIEVPRQGAAPSFELMWAAREHRASSPRFLHGGFHRTASRCGRWSWSAASSGYAPPPCLLAAAGVAWLAWLRRRGSLAATARLRPRPTAFAGFALLAILHTWPCGEPRHVVAL